MSTDDEGGGNADDVFEALDGRPGIDASYSYITERDYDGDQAVATDGAGDGETVGVVDEQLDAAGEERTEWVPESVDRDALTDTGEEVIRAAVQMPDASQGEIAAHVDMARSTAGQILREHYPEHASVSGRGGQAKVTTDEVLDAIREEPGSSIADIGRALDVSRTTAGRHVDDLIEDGRVEDRSESHTTELYPVDDCQADHDHDEAEPEQTPLHEAGEELWGEGRYLGDIRSDLAVIESCLKDNRPLEALKHCIDARERYDEEREEGGESA